MSAPTIDLSADGLAGTLRVSDPCDRSVAPAARISFLGETEGRPLLLLWCGHHWNANPAAHPYAIASIDPA